jgi:hypothetical protein
MRTAEVGNWTGLALVCPRTDLVKLGKRDATHGAGVYLLLAPSETLSARLRVYVGEADGLDSRPTTTARIGGRGSSCSCRRTRT